jgi:hypothetical protein
MEMVKYILYALLFFLTLPLEVKSQAISPSATIRTNIIATPRYDSIGTWVVFPWDVHKKTLPTDPNSVEVKLLRVAATLQARQSESTVNNQSLLDYTEIVLDSLKKFRPRYCLLLNDTIYMQIQKFAKPSSELLLYAFTSNSSKLNLVRNPPAYITNYFQVVHLQIHNSLRLPPAMMNKRLNPIKYAIWQYNLRHYRFSIRQFFKWWNSLTIEQKHEWKPILRGG